MGNRIDAAMDAAISNGKIVGAELIVVRHGDVVFERTAGWFDREADRPMMSNAIYRLASVTKPIVAATALAMADKGLIGLTDPVVDHLPYFDPKLPDGRPGEITIHHLLTHTAGLAYDYPADPEISTGLGPTDLGFEENFTRLARQPLRYAPGTQWLYSVAIDVLGAILAKVHGGSLKDAVVEHITGPLGMDDTGFFVADPARLAKPYGDDSPAPVPMGEPHGVINDQGNTLLFSPARIFSAKAFQSGGAGMAGSPADIVKFLETLRNGGGAVLKKDTVARGFSNRIGDVRRDDPGRSFGYFGAITDDPVAAQSPVGRGAISWGGVYGHEWLVDPVNGITMVSMSNTAVEGCTGRYPKDVRDAVYAEFV